MEGKFEKRKNITIIIVMAVILYGLFFLNIFKPEKEVSDSERRYLATFPKINFSAIKTGKFMQDFESYSMDQFPLRESFRRTKAVFTFSVLLQKDKDGIFYENGHFSELGKRLDEDSLSYAAKVFSGVYETYLKNTDCKLYFSIIPDKNYFMPDNYPKLDYEELFSVMRKNMEVLGASGNTPCTILRMVQNIPQRLEQEDTKSTMPCMVQGTPQEIQYISIEDTLQLSDYYKTDPHWRQEKIVNTAVKLGNEMGVSIPQDYEERTLSVPFYGVYCGQSALRVKGESLNYLTNPIMDSLKVTLHEKNLHTGIYDMEKAFGRDSYEMFLSGSQPLITIENPSSNSERELIVFRDSFGSSIAPLLAQGYKKVTLIDIRYIPSANLKYWIDFTNQDVLFLYSTLLLNNSKTLK